jgi:hypothetical protein
LGLTHLAYNNVELPNANYWTIKILNVILSTFNFHTQLVHTFDDFIHRWPKNMLTGTNTKFINQHTLHKTPYLFNLWKHDCCYICIETISTQWKMELNIVDVATKQSKKTKNNIKNHKNVFSFILSISTWVLHALNPCSHTFGSSFPCIFLHIFPPHLKSTKSLLDNTLNIHKPRMEGEK